VWTEFIKLRLTFGARRKSIFPAPNYGIFNYVVGGEEGSTYHPFPARLVLKDVLKMEHRAQVPEQSFVFPFVPSVQLRFVPWYLKTSFPSRFLMYRI